MSETLKLHRFINGHRGSLNKLGKVIKQWRSRYFVLDKRLLKVYNDETMAQIHADMVIDENTQIYDVTEDVDGISFTFYVVGRTSSGTDEVMFLAASGEKEKQNWIEAIIDAAHDGFKQIHQPELWSTPFFPSIDITVYYPKSQIYVENGNFLRPLHVEISPALVLKGASPEENYCMIMVDMDYATLNDNPSERIYLNWGILNFQGSDLKSGNQVVSYNPPAPQYNSGLHRYFFLVYKQSGPLTPVLLNEVLELFVKREAFNLQKFMKIMNFEAPVGVNGFYSGWEEYCDELHQCNNYLPPEQYRSPGQEAALNGAAEQQKIEKAKLDLFRELRLRDIFYGEEDKINTAGVPSVSMVITYNDNEYALDGNILSPATVERPPFVIFKCPATPIHDEMFTLIMTDPDHYSRVNHALRENVHWMVVNISHGMVEKGEVLLPYMSPAPFFSSGMHRYVFCLYKQTQRLNEEEIARAKEVFSVRHSINSGAWIRTMSEKYIVTPVGLEAFVTEWDQYVDTLHTKLKITPPTEFQSPNQSLGAPGVELDLTDSLVEGHTVLENTSSPWAVRDAKEAEIKSNLERAEASLKTISVSDPFADSKYENANNLPTNETKLNFGDVKISEGETVVNSRIVKERVNNIEQMAAKSMVKTPSGFNLTSMPVAMRSSSSIVQQPTSEILKSLAQTSRLPARDALKDIPLTEEEISTEHRVEETQSTVVTKEEIREETTTKESRREELETAVAIETNANDEAVAQMIEEQQEQIRLQAISFEEKTQQDLQSAQLQLQSNPPQEPEQKQLLHVPEIPMANDTKKSDNRTEDTLVTPVKSQTEAITSTPSTTNITTAPTPNTDSAQMKKKPSLQRNPSVSSMAGNRRTSTVVQNTPSNTIAVTPAQTTNNEAVDAPLTISTSPATNDSKEKQQQLSAENTPNNNRQNTQSTFEVSDLDQLLTPNYSNVKDEIDLDVDDDTVKSKDTTSTKDNKTDRNNNAIAQELGIPIGNNLVTPPSNRTPPTTTASNSSANTPNANANSASGKSRFSMFRSRSQYIAMPSDPTTTPNGNDTAATSSTSEKKPGGLRRLVSSASMYIKPQSAAQEIRAQLPPDSNISAMCQAFGIESSSVFEGEIVKKKYSTDFMAKDTFVWIDPKTKSLHWAKSISDRRNSAKSKYIVLDRLQSFEEDGTDRPGGEVKGLLQSVDQNGPLVIIRLESGEHLELKLSLEGQPPAQKRAADWVKVIKSFLEQK